MSCRCDNAGSFDVLITTVCQKASVLPVDQHHKAEVWFALYLRPNHIWIVWSSLQNLANNRWKNTADNDSDTLLPSLSLCVCVWGRGEGGGSHGFIVQIRLIIFVKSSWTELLQIITHSVIFIGYFYSIDTCHFHSCPLSLWTLLILQVTL